MDKAKRYALCCVDAHGASIHQMVDDSREITRRTFLKHVDHESLQALEQLLAYARHPSQGLTMAADWHVSYHKSRYRGKPCVYFVHSAIEYIFY